MDKDAIKKFAVESRSKLIENVKYSMNKIGITENEIKKPINIAEGIETFNIGGSNTYSIYNQDITKRKELIEEINIKGYGEVVEEVAYTWFNRIIAIRYMEVNNYLPTKTRVLSSDYPEKKEPDIITEALDIDLDYTTEDKKYILKLKDENKLDELFQFLFIKQCNKLNEILPNLFEKTDDYLELLLDISFINEDGIIRQLINTISEEDFTEGVEIIGWLYQYYNSEKKDDLIKNNKKIKKYDLPSVTQLFTTDWIVKYMVDNSLGRYWIERNPDSNLKDSLEYYLEEEEQFKETMTKLKNIREKSMHPEEIKFFDPCSGSGHILVYAFDVFMEIYRERGYSERDIPELILKNNIFGLDIDDRAYQLSYFSVLMKARSYDRKIFSKNSYPNIYAIQESNNITRDIVEYIKKYDEILSNDINYLLEVFNSAKEKGSLIKVNNLNYENMETKLNKIIKNKGDANLENIKLDDEIQKQIVPLINQAKLLSLTYDIVVTNPPYLNTSKYEESFKKFAKKEYKDYSKDMFSMFMYRNFDFCKENGYSAFMTPYAWMFIKTYQKIREYIIKNKSIISLTQLEFHAFYSEAYVAVCTFILSNNNIDYNGTYVNLSDFTGGMSIQNQKFLEAKNNNVDYKYNYHTKDFTLPGNPIIYSEGSKLNSIFANNNKIKDIGQAKQGLATGNNDKFLRQWYEVDVNKINFNCSSCEDSVNNIYKWYPYNKGGNYRKWYGNQDYIINWQNNGYEIRDYRNSNGKLKSRPRNTGYYFHESLSWSKISQDISFRYFPEGFIFDVAGTSVFVDRNNLKYIFGFLNSNISNYILKTISPTMNFEVGTISSLPIIPDKSKEKTISKLVSDNIYISKEDWDDYEVSWNFKVHPFIKYDNARIEERFDEWQEYKLKQFNRLRGNEIELNKIFDDIYDLDVDTNVEDKHVSVTLADYEKDVKSFISYAVGCMFGRYSLDKEGLICAGSSFNVDDYSEFMPDNDNIIPVLDTEYFSDDIVNRFIEFVKVVCGEEYLEDNLNFIAGGLKEKSNKSSREIIRDYFLKEFFKDHKQMYNKRPIYWQFSSGKQNGFNCLIYMHRYDSNTVARVRTEYLHKTQKAIEQRIDNCDNILNNTTSSGEKSKVNKLKNKLLKQLDETREYDEALAHIANQSIDIDLDDGVKVNYEKFQNVEVSKEGHKTKKINLLKKI